VPPLTSTRRVLAASSALGLTYLNCANDPSAPGAGCTRLDLTFGEDGLRQSSFDAFLPPALVRARPNLTIVPKAVCLKIDIAEGRATGIHLEHEDVPGKIYHVHASKEIVLCAGAIGTPQLLMLRYVASRLQLCSHLTLQLLSGVGPADHLKEVGIPLVLDLPAVGATLQDHPAVRTVWATDVRDTVHAAEHFWLLIRELFLLIIYGTGLFIAPSLHLSIFAHTSLLDESSRCGQVPPDIVPDVEVMPIPCNSQTPHFKDDFGPMEGG
jgi:choline dehydrogenase